MNKLKILPIAIYCLTFVLCLKVQGMEEYSNTIGSIIIKENNRLCEKLTLKEKEVDSLNQELDLARKMGVVSAAHLRHSWHKNCWQDDNENWHIDYTDIDEAINANGYVGKITIQKIVDHLNTDPCHNGNPNPYYTVLHKYRGDPH